MYALIGQNALQNFMWELQMMMGNNDYRPMEIEDRDFDDFMAAKDFSGLNILHPYKKAIFSFCSDISETSRKTNCIDTVTKGRNGALHGHNSAYRGFIYAVQRQGFVFKDKRVLVLGDGALGRTIQRAILDMEAVSATIVSRKGEVNYGSLRRYKYIDAIINATPVGMYPGNGKSLIRLSDFPRCSIVIDAVYNPLNSQLIQQAQRIGIPYMNGIPILVGQAAYSSYLFTGKMADGNSLEEIISKFNLRLSNLILIGNPSAQRSRFAAELAAAIGRELIDADLLAERGIGEENKPLYQRNWKNFAQSLDRAAFEAGSATGCVLAASPAFMLRGKSRNYLLQNGRPQYLSAKSEKSSAGMINPLNFRSLAKKLCIYDKEGENIEVTQRQAREIFEAL